MIESSTRTKLVEEALGYPYDTPNHPFVVDTKSGEVLQFDDGAVKNRIPVIAVGANASPRKLISKFYDTEGDPIVPVSLATVVNYDVVYSRIIAPYGSVPATLERSQGTWVKVKVNWLTNEQYQKMHKTEGLGYTYGLVTLDPEHIIGDDITTQRLLWSGDRISYYRSIKGKFTLDGQQVALASVHAHGRTYQEMTEAEVLGIVAERLSLPVSDFIIQLIEDDLFREWVIRNALAL